MTKHTHAIVNADVTVKVILDGEETLAHATMQFTRGVYNTLVEKLNIIGDQPDRGEVGITLHLDEINPHNLDGDIVVHFPITDIA